MSSNFARFGVQFSAALTTFRYVKNMSWLLDQKSLMSVFTIVFRIALAMCAVMFASHASAQTVFTYANTTNGAIDGSTTCAAPLVRNFNVTDNFTVSDVDLGFFATHTWRGDIRLTLQSPTGTRVQLVDGDANSTSGDNLNVLLDDAFAQTVNTDSATAAHSTTAPPPFANNFNPNAALSAFNGENSTGTWRLEICDIFSGADNGTFQHAELYLTSTPTNYADLSLTKSVDDANPVSGQTITFTLVATNDASSPQTATGITVLDALPAGLSFVSSSDPVNYSSGTGVWNVGTLAPGATATLTIDATVTATSGATVLNEAEITNSSRVDLDSTPNNGANGEDDYDSASITVGGSRVAGTPPTLTCPAGSILFDWDTRTWAAGSTNNSYALGALGNINFNLALPAGGSWLNLAALGGQSPNLQNQTSGGLVPAELSLVEGIDLANRGDVVTTTITLPSVMEGAQFTVFDVDFGNNQFADRITVRGLLEGAVVMPTLTNGTANFVIGNSAFGDVTTANNLANANVVVTFDSPIDTIVIEYGNHSLAPVNPGQQAMAIHDITFCQLGTTLAVAKSSSVVSDPVNGSTNPKAMPGAVLRYCILVSNVGVVTARNIEANDTLPTDITFVPGTIRSGTTCASAAAVEDDNGTGADETDPAGASFNTGVLNYTTAAVGVGGTAAFTFEATIN